MLKSVNVFASAEELAHSLAGIIIRDLDRLSPDEYYSIALSGGSTPMTFFRILADHYSDTVTWEKVLIFWGDERCVSPESNESNFKMANDILLRNVGIPDTNIFRIRGEADPEEEAAGYSSVIRDNLPDVNGAPQIDLMLLGLGDDGHTASIFPDHIKLFNSHNLFEATVKPDGKQKRITATGRLINNSAKVVFLVTGAGKAEIVSSLIDQRQGYEQYPASRVRPSAGILMWYLDADAASMLKGR